MGQLPIAIILTVIVFVIVYYGLKIRTPKYLLINAAIITAPWFGGLWLGFIKMDLRLTHMLVILAFFFSFSQNRSGKFKSGLITLIIVFTIAFIFWSTIASAAAWEADLALGGVFSFFLNFLFLITIVRVANQPKDIENMIKSLTIGLFITTFLCIIQYKYPTFSIGFIDRGFSTFLNWRPRSTFHHANQYGFYLMLTLPFVFRQIVMKYAVHDVKETRFYVLALLFGMFALYSTSNRGSWIGLSVGLLVTVLLDFFRRIGPKMKQTLFRVLIGFTVLVLVASVRYGGRVYERMFTEEFNYSVQKESRKDLNEDAYKIIAEYPITGVGVWNFHHHSFQIIFTHNLYLMIMSEIGYPGFVFFIIVCLGFLAESLLAIFTKEYHVSNYGSALLASLIGFSIASIPGPDFWISNQVGAHLWIIAGLIIAMNSLYRLYRRSQRSVPQRRRENNSAITE